MSTSKYRYVSMSALLLVATGCAWLPRSTDITLDAATYQAGNRPLFHSAKQFRLYSYARFANLNADVLVKGTDISPKRLRSRYQSSLFLSDLTELMPDEARALGLGPHAELDHVFLDGLSELDVQIAQELIKFGGKQPVFDPALTRSLSSEAYNAIAGFQGRVDWRP